MQTPLASLVRERMAHLGLTMPAVAARLGYTNTNKGSRRLQSMMAGDIAAHRDILSRLAEALEISDESIAEAVRASAALKEQAYRANFVPHAIIVTERTIPSQITFCALTRGEAALRITLDTTRPQEVGRRHQPQQRLSELRRGRHEGRTRGAKAPCPLPRPSVAPPCAFSVCSHKGRHASTQDPFAIPWVIVRIECILSTRKGCYRLARLAARYGPEQNLEGLLADFAHDCPWWRTNHRKYDPRCGAQSPTWNATCRRSTILMQPSDSVSPVVKTSRSAD